MAGPDHANPSVSNADPDRTTGVGTHPAAVAVSQSVTGRYTLGDEIARGGMGIIYRATDTVLGREVAVKVLQDKYGPTSGVAVRFGDEARITGQLQHPSIPPVHDLGTLPDGRPFLAMKLIKGQTLEDLLRARPDAAADRGRFVAAFEQICQALAYAHAHDIVHRDLKPANVMVGAFGEVQVLDWGLAKILGARSGEVADPVKTSVGTRVVSLRDSDRSFTQAGSVLGTPAFMPPEQAIGAVDLIDARSDVFGLGGILCAILTGRPPFVGDTAEATRVMAARGQVTDAFSRLDACGADPDLVSLCKRCLAPEKDDRPADASEVAKTVAELRAAADERARRAELERVRFEGVQATAEARAAERRKRRRLWLGAAAVLAVAVVGGLTAVVVVQRRANAELAEEQAKVEARFKMAADSIELFHTVVSKEPLLQNPGFKDLRTKLLNEAARFYADLEKLLAGQSDAKSRRTLAAGYFQLAELADKLGDKKQALAVHRQALAVRQELAVPSADVATCLEVARSLGRVGALLGQTGDLAAALRTCKEMRDLAERLESLEPTDAVRYELAEAHRRIASVLGQTGKPVEGMVASRKALAICQKLVDANPDNSEFLRELALVHYSSGLVLMNAGKPAEALASFRQELDHRQNLAIANATTPEVKSELATCHLNIGWVLQDMGKLAEALGAYRDAMAICQKLVDDYPAVNHYQANLAMIHNNSGNVLKNTGKRAEGLEAHRKALAIRQKLVDENHTATSFQYALAMSHGNIGLALAETGKPTEALAAYREALAICQKLVDENQTHTGWKGTLAYFTHLTGEVLAQTGKPAEALEAFRKALDIRQMLVDDDRANTGFQDRLADSHNTIGRVHARQAQFLEAFTALDAGLAIRQQLAEADRNNTSYSLGLGTSHAYRGGARVLAGQPGEAAADLRRALELWARAPHLDCDEQFERSRVLALLAGLGGDAKSGVTTDEAKTFADQAVAALAAMVETGWANPSELKEPDFAALRGRPDFQKLFAEVDAKVEKPAEPAPPPGEKK